MAELYDKTTALLIAQQFYIEEYLTYNNNESLTNKQKKSLLESVGESVSLHLRCKPMPICNESAKYFF